MTSSVKNIRIPNMILTLRVTLNNLLIFCVIIGTILKTLKYGAASNFSYFTVQSNLLCLITGVMTIIFVIKKRNLKDQKYLFIKGMALVSILLIFLFIILF